MLDFIHVCEHVWKASLAFYEETESARQECVQERLLRIQRGKATLVAAGIRRSATRRKLTTDERENVDRCADYLLSHAPYLHSHEYLAAGFPIATGVIEGACRYLVSDRIDPRARARSLRPSPPEEKPLTEKGTLLGTFQYMAPEQIEGEEADARSDIFALGPILYEMVTGQKAFSIHRPSTQLFLGSHEAEVSTGERRARAAHSGGIAAKAGS